MDSLDHGEFWDGPCYMYAETVGWCSLTDSMIGIHLKSKVSGVTLSHLPYIFTYMILYNLAVNPRKLPSRWGRPPTWLLVFKISTPLHQHQQLCTKSPVVSILVNYSNFFYLIYYYYYYLLVFIYHYSNIFEPSDIS